MSQQPPPLPSNAPQSPRVVPPNLAAHLRKPRRTWLYFVLGGMGCVGLLGLCVVGGIAIGIGRWVASLTPDQPGYVANDPAIKQTSTTVNSAGVPVAVDVFEPTTPGKYPVVMVVHGLEGLEQPAWRKYYQGQCQELVRNDYIAVLVHYFDKTGTKSSDLPTAKKNTQEWGLTLLDGMSYAAQLPNAAQEKKIGVVGTNAGGVLSVALATFDPRIGAIVQHSGVIPEEMKGKMSKLPPVLLLHGAKNRFVPLDRVQKSEKLLQESKTLHEVHIYPDQTHAFKGQPARDALERTIGFFKKHLK